MRDITAAKAADYLKEKVIGIEDSGTKEVLAKCLRSKELIL